MDKIGKVTKILMFIPKAYFFKYFDNIFFHRMEIV